MKRNSLFSLLSIAAVVLLLVAACGDDDDEDPTATSPSAGGAPTETRAPSGETPSEGGDETAEEGENGGGDLAAMGEELYASQGCNACHSVDGSQGVGPTWQGLFGSEVTLEGGETVTADETYIMESIHDPTAKVHEGFQPIMPAFPNLTDEQINAIIEFMKTLS